MKRIGITQRVVFNKRVKERRDVLDQQWHAFAAEMGVQFVPIPNTLSDPAQYAEQLQLDGLIFSGGNNVAEIAEETFDSLIGNDIAIERDKTEKKLLEWAIKANKPVIGVCRGIQFIYTFFGGRLKEVEADIHVAREHNISFTDEHFSNHYGSIKICNSYHRKGMRPREIPSDLKICGWYENEIEAFKHHSLSVFGIMWHPERYNTFRKEDIQFFQHVLKSN